MYQILLDEATIDPMEGEFLRVDCFNRKEIKIYISGGVEEMKKALIICAAGMSSSMMASKTTDLFKQQGKEILVDAVSATEGDGMIASSDFDLFLISPQTTMYLEKFQQLGKEVGKPVVSVPFQAYVPIPTGIQKLAEVIEEHIE